MGGGIAKHCPVTQDACPASDPEFPSGVGGASVAIFILCYSRQYKYV